MSTNLTIEQVKQHPADFMYVYAYKWDQFLNAIPKKYAQIITGKAVNQRKVLAESAKHNGLTLADYEAAVKEGFVNIYDTTPRDALIVLAQGGEIAGKNWEAGVFGIGSRTSNFNGMKIDGKDVTVREEDGHIFIGTTDVTDESKTVVKTILGKAINYQLFSTPTSTGTMFESQYNKTYKKYYAKLWVEGDGKKYRASDGKEVGNTEGASVWGDITLSIETFLNWLLSLFGISVDSDVKQLSADNTLPNQKNDGFVYESGFGEAGAILLALAAGGLVLANSKKKGKRTIA